MPSLWGYKLLMQTAKLESRLLSQRPSDVRQVGFGKMGGAQKRGSMKTPGGCQFWLLYFSNEEHAKVHLLLLRQFEYFSKVYTRTPFFKVQPLSISELVFAAYQAVLFRFWFHYDFSESKPQFVFLLHCFKIILLSLPIQLPCHVLRNFSKLCNTHAQYFPGAPSFETLRSSPFGITCSTLTNKRWKRHTKHQNRDVLVNSNWKAATLNHISRPPVPNSRQSKLGFKETFQQRIYSMWETSSILFHAFWMIDQVKSGFLLFKSGICHGGFQ